MKILDQAGIFSAIQLGEWGYYFHNLSPTESWWHDVYGKDFGTYKHLVQPPGLKGYDRQPASRRECYEAVRDYFLTRNRYMRGRNMSVTGHSHYEAYAAEWVPAWSGWRSAKTSPSPSPRSPSPVARPDSGSGRGLCRSAHGSTGPARPVAP